MGFCKMGTVIITASGKGGTGKTSFCCGVAVALCAQGEKVLLVDADSGLRNLDLVLGMTDKLLFSFSDVIMGRSSLKEAAVKHPIVKNLRVLTAPAASAIEPGVNKKTVGKFLANCRAHFTYTIVDCSAGLADLISDFGAGADRAVIVSTPDYTSLRGAQTAAQMFFEQGLENVKIVVNRVRPGMIDEGAMVNIDNSMDISGLGLLGIVPEDKDVISCENAGQILMLNSRGQAVQAYNNIARRIAGEKVRLMKL